MIAVRLLPYEPKSRFFLRTYVSAKGGRYTAGSNGIPSNWKIVSSAEEISELEELDQFEIREVKDLDELHKDIQSEMEDSVRMGGKPVKAVVENDPSAKQRDLSAMKKKGKRRKV